MSAYQIAQYWICLTSVFGPITWLVVTTIRDARTHRHHRRTQHRTRYGPTIDPDRHGQPTPTRPRRPAMPARHREAIR